MPTFYDKMFKPSKSKITRNKLGMEEIPLTRNEWSHDNQIQEPIKLKDAEDYIIRQMFKTKKLRFEDDKETLN